MGPVSSPEHQGLTSRIQVPAPPLITWAILANELASPGLSFLICIKGLMITEPTP